jgi:histidine triad (HIT) family protein
MSDMHDTCVFCKIVDGRIPSWRVFEDENTLAFLDIGPLAPGHLLVIPRRHFERLWDMAEPVAAALAASLPRLSRAVVRATGADGCNVLQSNGEVSGQLVPHVHFHIIPRKSGDGLGYRWPSRTYAEGEAQAIQNRIAALLE